MNRFLPLLALVAACATRPGPKAVLLDYLEAESVGKYEVAHALLTDEDQRARPVERYIEDHLSAGPIWLAVARRTNFRAGRVDDRDDHLRVEVKATHLDMRAVEQGIQGLPTDVVATSPDPAARVAAHVEQQIATRPFPEVTEAIQYAVREQPDGWRVWLGLSRQDAAIQAVVKARKATAAGDTATAKAAWEHLLTLPPDPSGVVDALQDEARTALGQ